MPIGALPPRGPGVLGFAGELVNDVLDEAVDLWLTTTDSITPAFRDFIGIVNGVRKGVVLIVEGFPGPLDFLSAGPFVVVTDPAKFYKDAAEWLNGSYVMSRERTLVMFSPKMGPDP